MAYTQNFSVRLFKARPDLKDAFRIRLSRAALSAHKLESGDLCELRNDRGASGIAIAWLTREKELGNAIIQTSETLRTAFNFSLGDKLTVVKADSFIEDAQDLHLTEINQDCTGREQSSSSSASDKDDIHWAWYLDGELEKAETVCQGMVFENVKLRGLSRSFRVDQIDASAGREGLPRRLYRFHKMSRVRLNSPLYVTEQPPRLEIKTDGLGGLDQQINQLNKRLSDFNKYLSSSKLPASCRRRRRRGGILLHGPEGTGKSLLLEKLAAASWRKVCTIDKSIVGRYLGDTEAAVRKVFTEALEYQPSLIIIDELQAIAGKTQSGSLQIDVASVIGSELDRLEDSRVLVVAATRRANEIDECLRKRGRLRSEIDIPIPDTNARIEILKVLRGLSLLDADELSESIGERTHGFVGSDLEDLVEVAEEIAQDRHEAQSSNSAQLHKDAGQSQVDNANLGEDSDFQVRQEDFESALLRVRPSAMREVFLDSPKVRWNDIGGQEDVKETLRQLVEWPIRDAAHMAWLGISPKKGLLLYGPPGCSKTLTAQALATEAGLNFIAVKGAELLSMYVGESERAVREVFRKARAASPSIIFFDEIDAIGASREGGGQGSGVNVLTTILNEMDGIEQLKGVLVLAATNKPEVLDPALMRPGRLGTALYVGPPDLAARTEILTIQSRKMKFGEDVDIDDLASRSEGYSGAEMVYVCEEAGSGAMTEYEREGIKVKICKRHFDSAMAKVPMQITSEVRARYENWSVGGVKKL